MGNPFKSPKAPPPPEPVKVPEATVMPIVDQTEVNKNRKKAAASASARSGRVSTIMSDSGTLGG